MNRIELERNGKKEYETSNETEKGDETEEERIGVKRNTESRIFRTAAAA